MSHSTELSTKAYSADILALHQELYYVQSEENTVSIFTSEFKLKEKITCENITCIAFYIDKIYLGTKSGVEIYSTKFEKIKSCATKSEVTCLLTLEARMTLLVG